VLREARRREWREELRMAALERKGLKERIAQLEARAEKERAESLKRLDLALARIGAQQRTIEALLVEKRQHLAGLEEILAECQPAQNATLFRIESIAIRTLNK
jgi:gamma-glutamylcysteine synthetase